MKIGGMVLGSIFQEAPLSAAFTEPSRSFQRPSPFRPLGKMISSWWMLRELMGLFNRDFSNWRLGSTMVGQISFSSRAYRSTSAGELPELTAMKTTGCTVYCLASSYIAGHLPRQVGQVSS